MITYKGIDYPTRTFDIIIDGNTTTITIASDKLSQAFGEYPIGWDEDAVAIDNTIYHYVERKYWKKSNETIARYHLDEDFELAVEEDYQPQNN